MLVSYIKSKENLNKQFQFEKVFVFREKVEEYILQCKNSDILLCSCYVWNWEIMTHLAEQVKKLISEHLNVDESKIKPESYFINDLGADEYDVV